MVSTYASLTPSNAKKTQIRAIRTFIAQDVDAIFAGARRFDGMGRRFRRSKSGWNSSCAARIRRIDTQDESLLSVRCRVRRTEEGRVAASVGLHRLWATVLAA